jgi:hypothetical protein
LSSNYLGPKCRGKEATLVRKEMKDVGIKKGAGCSWVTVKKKVHIFQAKDTSQEKNSEIQAMLVKPRRQGHKCRQLVKRK